MFVFLSHLVSWAECGFQVPVLFLFIFFSQRINLILNLPGMFIADVKEYEESQYVVITYIIFCAVCQEYHGGRVRAVPTKIKSTHTRSRQ